MWPSEFWRSRGDDAALIIRGDRGMSALADGHAQDTLLQVGQLPRVEEPFQEVGRPQVYDVQPGPVEDLFGDEGITTRLTRRPPVRGPLGLVEHRRDAGLLRGLGEVHRGMDEAGRHRPDEVGRIHALHCRSNGVDVEQVSLHDLGAEGGQGVRTFVHAVDQGTHGEPQLDRLGHGRAAGIPGRTGDQDGLRNGRIGHRYPSRQMITVRPLSGPLCDTPTMHRGTPWEKDAISEGTDRRRRSIGVEAMA